MADKDPHSNEDIPIPLLHRAYQVSWPMKHESTEDSKSGNIAGKLRDPKEYDITLVVGDTRIAAHKSLLVTASEYFRAMFSGDFSEANRSEIKLQAISAEGLKTILDAMYAGELSLTSSNVLEILKTADQLEIQEVIDCCEDFLVLGTDKTNCLELLQLSEKYTLPGLNQGIEQFVLGNFPDVCDHYLFPCISQDALITFISNDELDFKELDIFHGVMKWFKDDPDGIKRGSVTDILDHLRFTYMDSKDILNEVLTHPLILESTDCKSAVEEALRYVIEYEEKIFERPILEASNKQKPRGKLCVATVPPKFAQGDESRMLNVPALKKLMFFGLNEGLLDMSDMTVCESNVDFAVFSMNILSMGHSIFFLGAHPLGEDGKDASMALLRFNIQSGEWVALQAPEFSPAVVSVSLIHKDYLYLFGGAAYSNQKTIPQSTFKKECYRYSIRDNLWSSIADYPHPVSHPAACVVGDEIFVIGGGGTNVNTYYRDRVYAYNTTEDMWTEMSPLNIGRAGHRACTVGHKIYVLGGRDLHRDDVPECEVYDPSADKWSVLENAPIPTSVASYAMVLQDESITLLGGGCDKEIRHPLVQTLNTKELSWKSYSWKEDHPDLLFSGSIHTLPLLRVRLSVCPRYVTETNTTETNTTEYQLDDDEANSTDLPSPSNTSTKHKRNTPKHCSTQ